MTANTILRPNGGISVVTWGFRESDQKVMMAEPDKALDNGRGFDKGAYEKMLRERMVRFTREF